MRALKIALCAAAVGAVALFAGSGTTSAMPVGGLKAASSDLSEVQDVRYRRWRRYYAAPYAYRPYAYAYSPYYAYYGWPYYRPYWGYGWGWGSLWW